MKIDTITLIISGALLAGALVGLFVGERLTMALIGLIFCGILHVLATSKLNGLRE
jgi:hypothetical protein